MIIQFKITDTKNKNRYAIRKTNGDGKEIKN